MLGVRRVFPSISVRDAFEYPSHYLFAIVEVSFPLGRYLVVDVTDGVASFLTLYEQAVAAGPELDFSQDTNSQYLPLF